MKTVRQAVNSNETRGEKDNTEMEQDSFQVAYTTGGATVGVTMAKVNNADYTENKDEKQTLLSLGISF